MSDNSAPSTPLPPSYTCGDCMQLNCCVEAGIRGPQTVQTRCDFTPCRFVPVWHEV